jgi:hypothetical protein
MIRPHVRQYDLLDRWLGYRTEFSLAVHTCGNVMDDMRLVHTELLHNLFGPSPLGGAGLVV